MNVEWSVKPGYYPSAEGGDTDWWCVGDTMIINGPEADVRLAAQAPALKARVEFLEGLVKLYESDD